MAAPGTGLRGEHSEGTLLAEAAAAAPAHAPTDHTQAPAFLTRLPLAQLKKVSIPRFALTAACWGQALRRGHRWRVHPSDAS